LDLSLNRVVIEDDDNKEHGGAKQKGKKSYDLDATDKFWKTHKGSPFPTVAEGELFPHCQSLAFGPNVNFDFF